MDKSPRIFDYVLIGLVSLSTAIATFTLLIPSPIAEIELISLLSSRIVFIDVALTSLFLLLGLTCLIFVIYLFETLRNQKVHVLSQSWEPINIEYSEKPFILREEDSASLNISSDEYNLEDELISFNVKIENRLEGEDQEYSVVVLPQEHFELEENIRNKIDSSRNTSLLERKETDGGIEFLLKKRGSNE